MLLIFSAFKAFEIESDPGPTASKVPRLDVEDYVSEFFGKSYV
jgi:hypothetical protein